MNPGAGQVGRRLGRGRLVAVLASVALLAVACGVGPSPQPDSTPGTLPFHPGPVAPATPTGQFATDATLAIGLAGEPSNWNPLAAPGLVSPALAAVEDAVLPSAFVGTTDLTLDPLLTSATVTSSSPETVVYQINPRATWSDGVPITGADFVYTWEAQSGRSAFRDKGGRAFTPASTAGYRQIGSVTSDASDPDQVVVRFATPDDDWQALFDPILPAHVARSLGFDHGFTDPVTSLVSGGPFLVQSYQPGDDVLLVRNPSWWGSAAELSSLDVTFVDSASIAVASLEQGQLDAAVTAFAPATIPALRATPGLTVSVANGPDFDDLVFNERLGPLALRAFRLALIMAIDRRSTAQEAQSAGDSAAVPIDNRAFLAGTPGYRDDAAAAGPATGSGLVGAEALLRAAGYVRRAAVLLHDGKTVHLTLAVGTASPLASGEVAGIVAGARDLGIEVTTTTAPVGAASTGSVGGATAASSSGSKGGAVGAAPAADMALVEAPLSSSPSALAAVYATGAAGNLAGYSSPVMDGYLAELAAAAPGAESDDIADQVDTLAWEDAVDLPLLGVPTVVAYQSRYAALTPAPTILGVADDLTSWGIPASS